jgi:hypothetical protein
MTRQRIGRAFVGNACRAETHVVTQTAERGVPQYAGSYRNDVTSQVRSLLTWDATALLTPVSHQDANSHAAGKADVPLLPSLMRPGLQAVYQC